MTNADKYKISDEEADKMSDHTTTEKNIALKNC